MGLTANQDTLSETVQVVFEAKENVVFPELDDTLRSRGEMVRNLYETWVTVTVTGFAMPAPVIVIVATRFAGFVFWVNEAVNVPLLLPLVGETVSQAALSETVHVVLEVMVNVVEPSPEETFRLAGSTDKLAEMKL